MVLIITVIVVIILAATVILTITKNNPITTAKEATFKSDIRSFQDELSMYISNQILKDYYANREKETTSEEPDIDEMKKYILSFTNKYEGKLGIEKDELVYFTNKVTETEKKWLDDLGIKPAGYLIAEAHEECFMWSGDTITGYYKEKLNEYLEKTNGVLKIPKRCEKIGRRAFYSNSFVKNVVMQDGITMIDEQAFWNCDTLNSVYIPKSVSIISTTNTFSDCNNLLRIDVSEENEKYSSQDGVLYDKNKTRLIAAPGAIESCKIPDTVKTISRYSFANCNNLKDIEIPEGVTKIEDWAFSECGLLTHIDFPSTLTKIDHHSFYKTNLTGSVVIPDNVTFLGNNVFNNCNNINKIIIGSKVETITGEYYESRMDVHAFQFCSSLTEFEVKEENQNYSSQDGVLYNKDKSILICAPQGLQLNNLVLPEQVKVIRNGAFYKCKGLTGTLTLNKGLEKIESSSFQSCSNLSGQLIIPSTVKKIGDSTFLEAGFEGEVVIPSSVEEIGYQIFYRCLGLTKINCEALSKPDGWSSDWNYNCNAEVIWGYTKE